VECLFPAAVGLARRASTVNRLTKRSTYLGALLAR